MSDHINNPIAILLVINNHELRQLYHEILINEHWEIIVADQPSSGLLQLVSNPNINLIIFDLQIQPTEAKKFLQILQNKPKWKDIPLILLDYQETNLKINPLINQFPHVHKLDTHLTSPDELTSLVKKLT